MDKHVEPKKTTPQPIGKAMPQSIPGWSLAIQNLYEVKKANIGPAVLLIGEAGTPLKALAKRFCAKSTAVTEVDNSSLSIGPKVTAISYCRLSERTLPYHLDTLFRRPVPTSGGPILREGIADQFGTRFYMPPIRNRAIDIFAWLHALGKVKAASNRRLFISPRFLCSLLYDSSWPGNEAALMNRVGSLLDDRTHVIDKEPGKLGHRDDNGKRVFNSVDGYLHQQPQGEKSVAGIRWFCSDSTNIPLDRLSDIALKMFFNAFWHSQEEVRVCDVENDAATAEFDPIGEVKNWLASRGPLDAAQLKLLASSPSLRQGILPKEASEESKIQTASIAKLLSEFTLGLEPPGGWDAHLLVELARFRFMGTSLWALCQGIAAAEHGAFKTVINEMLRVAPENSTEACTKSQALTDDDKEVVDLLIRGHSQAEVAKLLEISTQAVSQRKQRAIKREPKLKSLLDKPRRRTRKLTNDPESIDKDLRRTQGYDDD